MAQMTLLGLIRIGRNGLYANRPLTGFPWAGPPPFDQVKRADLFTGMGLCWACHVSTYHRRFGSNEWMTSVPTVSRHVFPPANDDFTHGKSPLVGAVNGLSDPKPDPIA